MAKKIEVTDEMYEFLMNLSKEIKEQDNRCTATPYFFQVRETKEVPAHRGSGDEVYYSSEYEVDLRTDADKVDWIEEHTECFINTRFEEDVKYVGIHTSTWDLDEMLDELGFDRFYVNNEYVYSNAFFTSKACDDHIRINRHNLKHPVNYLTHAYRNSEMEMMYKFILGISNCEPNECTSKKMK